MESTPQIAHRQKQRRTHCPICGARTHEKKRVLLGTDLIPLTVAENGTCSVYKGVCVQPTCYTLEEAKRELGESGENNFLDLSESSGDPSPNFQHAIAFDPNSGDQFHSHDNSFESGVGADNSGIVESNDANPTIEDRSGSQSTPTMTEIATDMEVSSFDPDLRSSPWRQLPHPDPSDRMVSNPARNLSRRPAAPQPPAWAETSVRRPRLLDPAIKNQIDNSFDDPSSVDVEFEPDPESLETLRNHAEDKDFINFFRLLNKKREDSTVVIRALEVLRTQVYKEHVLDGNTQSVFPISDNNWVKSVRAALEEHWNDPMVQVAGVETYWVLGALGAGYLQDVLIHNGSTHVLKILSKFPGSDEVGLVCMGCLEMLTRRRGRFPTKATNDLATKQLMSYIGGPNSNGKDWAIRALFNISRQQPLFAPEMNSIFQTVKETDPDFFIVESLVDYVKKVPLYDVLAEDTLVLLYELALLGNGAMEMSKDMVGLLTRAMDEFPESRVVQLAATALICSFADKSEQPIGLRMSYGIDTLYDSVMNAMNCFPSDEDIAVTGVQALAILIYTSITTDEVDSSFFKAKDVTDVTKRAVDKFPENVQIVTHSCLVFLYTGGRDSYSKTVVSHGGAIEVVAKGLRTFNSMEDDTKELFLLGALSFFASASLDPTTADKIKSNYSVLTILSSALQEVDQTSVDANTTGCLFQLLIDYVPVEGTEDSVVAASAVDFLLGSSLAQDELEQLVETYAFAVTTSDVSLDALLLARNGAGASAMIELMRSHEASPKVQSLCCRILSQVYVKNKFKGVLTQQDTVSKRQVTTHTIEEVKSIRQVLRSYKTNSTILTFPLRALSNFLCGMRETVADEEDFEPSQELLGAFVDAVREIVDVLSVHGSDVNLCKESLRLIRCLIFLGDKIELKRWSQILIEKVLEASQTDFGDVDLQYNVSCALLVIALIEESDCNPRLGQPDSIRILLSNIDCGDEGVAEVATECMAVVSKNVLASVNQIIDAPHSVDRVVRCMFRFPHALAIQINCCNILNNLACVGDQYVKPMIANSGGVSALLDTLANHRRNETILEHAATTLSRITRGIHSSLIEPMRENFGKNILECMNGNKDKERIETPILEVFWFLCAVDKYFVSVFSDSDTIPAIVELMTKYLPNLLLQRAGCSCLWSMSSYKENKTIIESAGGLEALVNAVNFHISDSAFQKEALTTLKNMATSTTAKRGIASYDGIDAISRSMWVNIRSPEVQAAAYAALNNVCVDIAKKQVLEVSPSVLQCVIIGMKRYPSDKDVQNNACFLLKSLCYSENNLSVMQSDHSFQLMNVLTIAGSSFPNECSARVTHILGALERD